MQLQIRDKLNKHDSDAIIDTEDMKVIEFFKTYGELTKLPNITYEPFDGAPEDAQMLVESDGKINGNRVVKIVDDYFIVNVDSEYHCLCMKEGPGFSIDALMRDAKRSLYGHEFSLQIFK